MKNHPLFPTTAPGPANPENPLSRYKTLKLLLPFLLLVFLTPEAPAQAFETKDLEKAKGLILFLPERGVSAKCQLFQEAKPPRGILKPYLLNDGNLFEIENVLILEELPMSTFFPETIIENKEAHLSKAHSQLELLKEKYPKFYQEWEVIAKSQEKEKSFVAMGYFKQKNRWISPSEWTLLQKASSGLPEKAVTRLVTKEGKIFHNAKLSRVDGTTLIITHESGIAKIPKTDLPAQVNPPDPKLQEAIAKILGGPEMPGNTPDPSPTPAPTSEKPSTPSGSAS
jgi:hypothetical protein